MLKCLYIMSYSEDKSEWCSIRTISSKQAAGGSLKRSTRFRGYKLGDGP